MNNKSLRLDGRPGTQNGQSQKGFEACYCMQHITHGRTCTTSWKTVMKQVECIGDQNLIRRRENYQVLLDSSRMNEQQVEKTKVGVG